MRDRAMATVEKYNKEKFGAHPSALGKAVARKTAAVFGGKPYFGRFFSDDKKFHVDIITVENTPEVGLISAGTVGLSDFEMMNKRGEVFADTRLELVACYRKDFTMVRNVLFYCAFNIIRTPWVCSPGSVLEDVLVKFKFESPMRHLVFEQPFLWPDLDTIVFESKTVSWLLCIPVSEAERKLLKSIGMESFGKEIDKSGVDIFDWSRPSIV